MAGMHLNDVPTDNPAYIEFVRVQMENALGTDTLGMRMMDMTGAQLQRLRRVREAAHAAWSDQMSTIPAWATLTELDRLLSFVPLTADLDGEFALEFDGVNADVEVGDLIPAG